MPPSCYIDVFLAQALASAENCEQSEQSLLLSYLIAFSKNRLVDDEKMMIEL